MKYNNDILNKIVEVYSTEYHNNLGLDNITSGYIEMMKKVLRFILKRKIEVSLQNIVVGK